MVEERLVERGGAGQHGHPLLGDPSQRSAGVEDRFGEHRRPSGDRRQDPRLQAEHVEVRVHHEVAIAGGEAGHRHPVRCHPQRPAVRLHDPLRYPGGPGGEEDVRWIVGADRRAPALDLVTARPGSPSPRTRSMTRCSRTRGSVRDHDGLQVGKLGADVVEHRDVVRAEEVRDGDQHAGAAPGEDVGRLDAFEPGVDRHEDGTGLEDPEHGHDPLGAVEGPDRHPVARLDAGGHERRAEGPSLLGELGVGQPGRAVDDGEPLAAPRRGGGRHRRNAVPAAVAPLAHRRTLSSTFIRRARLPPMILRMDSSGSPASSST